MKCLKRPYPNERAAIAAATALRSKHGVLRQYLCFDCMKWHLTSENPRTYLKRNKHIGR